jgi:Spy/CpxP family protein refolding chaperone
MRTRAQSMHEEVEPLIAEAWSEMAKPQPDEAKINQLFDEAAAKRRALQRDMASQTLAFLATLSPEQRAKFIELGREHFSSRANRTHHHGAP